MLLTYLLAASLNAAVDYRIIGGREATFFDAPGIVSIQTPISDSEGGPVEYAHYCGGVYLGDRYVVTAAHCISDNMVVAYGAEDLSVMASRVEIDQLFVHRDYNRGLAANADLALLVLYEALPMAYAEISLTNTDLLDFSVAGWGYTDYANRVVPTKLYVASVNLYSKTVCQAIYPVDSRHDTGMNQETMLCAGSLSGDRDSCFGDSGGPLYGDVNGQKKLAGLVSWGPDGCAVKGYPGVYVKLDYFKKWIEDTIEFVESDMDYPALITVGPLSRFETSEFSIDIVSEVTVVNIVVSNDMITENISLHHLSSSCVGGVPNQCKVTFSLSNLVNTNSFEEISLSVNDKSISVVIATLGKTGLASQQQSSFAITSGDVQWQLLDGLYTLGSEDSNIGPLQRSIINIFLPQFKYKKHVLKIKNGLRNENEFFILANGSLLNKSPSVCDGAFYRLPENSPSVQLFVTKGLTNQLVRSDLDDIVQVEDIFSESEFSSYEQRCSIIKRQAGAIEPFFGLILLLIFSFSHSRKVI
jgi:secreted trypsin-like serine protease